MSISYISNEIKVLMQKISWNTVTLYLSPEYNVKIANAGVSYGVEQWELHNNMTILPWFEYSHSGSITYAAVIFNSVILPPAISEVQMTLVLQVGTNNL